MPPRRIVLVRHGRTAHNAGGMIQGQLDVPLDDVGREQARAAAAVLAELAPAVLLSSDLARAAATADAVGAAAGTPVLLDARLRELQLGSWQGLTSEQARERFPQQWADWRACSEVSPCQLPSWRRLAPLGNTCWSTLVEAHWGWRLERHNTGLGPLVGPPRDGADLGAPAVTRPAPGPGDEPVG